MTRTRCRARATDRRSGQNRIPARGAWRWPGGPGSCGESGLAQQRHHAFRVQIQEPSLIVAGRMEHQVIEAQVDVELDLLDVLFRISRNDPAAGGPLGW